MTKHGVSKVPLKFCAKHEQFSPQDEPCPWCEPETYVSPWIDMQPVGEPVHDGFALAGWYWDGVVWKPRPPTMPRV